MLALAPELVDMRRAVKDYHPGSGVLTRDAAGAGIYSPSGVYGDATLATPDKGHQLLRALVAGIIREIELLRATPA
jgi:creatinine amidohydrolase